MAEKKTEEKDKKEEKVEEPVKVEEEVAEKVEKSEKSSSMKEGMKASFKSIRQIIQVCEVLLIIVPIVLVIITACVSIGFIVSDNTIEKTNDTYTITYNPGTEDEEQVEVSALDMGTFAAYLIISLADYILMIVLLNNVKNIMKNIETSGNAFATDNVKHLDRITIITLILAVLRVISTAMIGANIDVGLIFVLIIITVAYAYKCGCKTANEVKE